MLVNGIIQFSAVVNPAGAPQTVTWEVLGGSSNGVIDTSGRYTAPASVPTTNPITVRAFCVDGSVAPGTAAVTIQPEPTGVTVNPPANSPPNWVAPDLTLGSSVTFSATVAPAAAPQGVNWRVIWKAQTFCFATTTSLD